MCLYFKNSIQKFVYHDIDLSYFVLEKTKEDENRKKKKNLCNKVNSPVLYFLFSIVNVTEQVVKSD